MSAAALMNTSKHWVLQPDKEIVFLEVSAFGLWLTAQGVRREVGVAFELPDIHGADQ